MRKIFFILAILTLALLNQGTDLYAQQETQRDKDTLIVGGIYRILLTNGRDFTGEITSNKDSTIGIRVGNENFFVTKNKIAAIANAGAFNNESEFESYRPVYINDKFKLLGSVQTGVSIPTGNFGDVYSTSSGFLISAYGFFSKFSGFGIEFQYNHFHGPQDYYTKWDTSGTNNTYFNTKYESGNFSSSMLKFNLMLGNLNPKSSFVFYGLLGFGLQLNKESDGKFSEIYSNYTTESTLEGDSEIAFMYGVGAGSFYKISQKIGISLEFQYNKLPSQDYNKYYGYYGYYGYNGYSGNDGNNGTSGFYSIRAGITYTNF